MTEAPDKRGQAAAPQQGAHALPPAGRFSAALVRMITKPARVVAAAWLDERFRLVTLEGAGFAHLSQHPGQKIQIGMGEGFKSRTYTPFASALGAGQAQILGFVHGIGPGCDWLRSAQPGTTCDVMGPRASLDLGRLASSIVLFGDETSFGLALAVRRSRGARALQFIFEADDVTAGQKTLTRFGLDDAPGLTRRPDDEHLTEFETVLSTYARSDAAFVLTGKASSIQRLRRALKRLDVPPARVMSKAYWAPGKTGMD